VIQPDRAPYSSRPNAQSQADQPPAPGMAARDPEQLPGTTTPLPAPATPWHHLPIEGTVTLSQSLPRAPARRWLAMACLLIDAAFCT